MFFARLVLDLYFAKTGGAFFKKKLKNVLI